MKYLKFHGHIVVPDSFEFDDDSVEDRWIMDYLVDFKGLCDFNEKTGCNPEHWTGFRLLSEQEFLEDD